MSDAREDASSVQIIRDDKGGPLYAVIGHAEFEELLGDRARRATGLAAAAEAIRSEGDRLALIPAEVVHRIAQGEHPVRVWRLHRGLKAVELAREAGISPGLLSEIETTRKDVGFKTMSAIAKTLSVKLDDLMPVIDEAKIDEHRREVQLRDIARRISEIDSMINGRKGFDSGAVRETAQTLINEATAFMADRAGKFDWLEGITDKARRTIDEINSTEKAIVQTVTETQTRLSEVFSDSLAKAGLFPREMLEKRSPPPSNGAPSEPPRLGDRPEPGKVPDAPVIQRPGSGEVEEEGERPRGWFLR